MNRRTFVQRTGLAALALAGGFPRGWAADAPKRRLLMFTRSVGFQHSVVQRKKGEQLSLAEMIVTDLGKKHGFEVNCTKDGRVFVNEDLSKYDGFVFETQGDLLSENCKDNSPPMTADGKQALLKAVASGKGFVGCHCASDTFHSKGSGVENQPPDQRDPYIAMVGGEFIVHGSQQKAKMQVADDRFPGAQGLKDFVLEEEWYALKNFAPDLHVILVQDTQGMNTSGGSNWSYGRPKYPATWARKHEKGRVFFTSMGHREDVWENPIFQQLLLGGLNWAVGNVEADVTPNINQVTPQASDLPKAPPPQQRKKKQ
jgi:type 1 glutamine amidotransferase